MATVTAFPSLYPSSSISQSNSHTSSSPSISSASSSLPFAPFQRKTSTALTLNNSHRQRNNKFGRFPMSIRSVAEETQETLIPAEEAETSDQPVSVPVSPSDILTMFFQAEGTMDESIAAKVTKALEEVEGISDLNVKVLEGIASVELKKQTTVQATGVASNLVEIIQGSGFKLQTLNLSFEDEEGSSS